MRDAERSIGDYGLDAPRVVGTVGLLGAVGLSVTVIAGVLDMLKLMAGAFAFTVLIAIVGLLMVRASRVSKLRQRVALIDRLRLNGDERVLDVGYGRGLLLIEAAHRMNAGGRAVGIDVWRTDDHSGIHPDAVLDNADAEGVSDRVDISIGDARALPFADESFHVVVSSTTPQNVCDHDTRVYAIREIDRVLTPGGRFLLIGAESTRDYVYALRSCNWNDVTRSSPKLRLFPPVRYVVGTKPDPSRESDVAEAHEAPVNTTSKKIRTPRRRKNGQGDPVAEPVLEPVLEPVVAEREGDEGEMSAAAAP